MDFLDNNDELYFIRKKLIYKSIYRGCKEMDLILGKYAKFHLCSMNYEGLLQYSKIMEIDDDLLYYYFCNLESVPTELYLIKEIISFHIASHASC
ncbi:succinate dehydrogenase assembly factor 2 [Anaplasmataceae bacterium AB001_6]|nr:succinate dehydrogenase assembly factor 2 [Anaplasmataceae bacterium AB001_6]